MPQFSVPDDSPPPSTPDRTSRGGMFRFDDHPSTTPAGPPPSSAASFTPAGAPSASYLGSSMMRGLSTSTKPVTKINFGSRASGGSKQNLLPRGTRSPLGRSIIGSKGRQPSRLSRQVAPDDDEDDEDEDEEDDDQVGGNARSAPRTFGLEYSDEDESDGDSEPEQAFPRHRTARRDEEQDDEDDGEYEGEDDGPVLDRTRDDIWLDQGLSPDHGGADDSDLMDLMTPAINDRVRREAEDIFRATTMQTAGRAARELNFAPVAKSLYEQMGYAALTEPPALVLETDSLVSQLYTEGVGAEDDEARLDTALARTSSQLVSLWQEYVNSLPKDDEEHAAGIGPGPHATPFENATFLARLALQVHHTRYADDDNESQYLPLPDVLFQWLGDNHNLYPNQSEQIKKHSPSPACHTLFWQTVFMSLLHGRVGDALSLLRVGGFDQVRKGRVLAYTDRALSNVLRAVHETCEVLEACPGMNGDWDLWNSDWTLFRVRARGALDQLRRFAEGKEKSLAASDFSETGRGRQSMAGMARKAESQVPWDIYENINIIFDIMLGSQERIVQVSQDWCEATIAMLGWWDEGRDTTTNELRMSQSLSRSRTLAHAASRIANPEDYLDRLARSFQTAVNAGLGINSNSPLEVGMACVFEDNPKGLVGILRSWSLPVASAVAEIATLGKWLPTHQPSAALGAFDLDLDDLEVLGLDPRSPDELDGIKDTTLVQYAQALVNFDELASVSSRSGGVVDGWELAIHILGRIDSREHSEDTIGELVKNLLDDVDASAGAVVDKVWRLLNDLGMVEFAEETAEHFGDALARESHSYGQAMWYYSLSHRPNKVREVMNLLISHSLLQSIAFPPDEELDEHLRRLLHDRNETLAQLASQDLEAAQLLGKMLSGYATLRRFYDIRDDEDYIPNPHRRAAAADALVSVIAACDDNVRGGLFDPTRDGLVSEDFLLALLGEATALVDSDGSKPRSQRQPVIQPGAKAVMALDHVDTLLKAAEDAVAIKSSSVYATCNEFFKLTLASLPGLKGSAPTDLMRRTAGGGGSTSSSYVLGGSSMLASQLHRSVSSASLAAKEAAARRGWDWRTSFNASTTADDVLRRLRFGVARDLARLWVEEADRVF
ncbi:hypothetical protein RB597_008318 [Gaeumannomyces tritici]